jgi:hypothetical protein
MKSKHLAKVMGALAAVVTAFALIAPAAGAATPKAGYERFAGCLSQAEYSESEICFVSTVTGGSVKLGNKNVPIEKPFTLSGSTNFNLENYKANSKGGLQVVKQKVPGGVVGLTGLTWLLELLGSEALTLYAATEMVGTPSFNLNEVNLPVKVHLINSTLGNNCYIGSAANPINFHLVTGTSGKLTGIEPTLGFEPKLGITEANGGKYVDGLFTAPGASGCVLTLFGFIPISINGLVNTASGLPAASGTNEAIQNIKTELVPTEYVYP